MIEPRDAQIEALYALNKTRQEGYSKALIQAATGVGKTYLAAFDSLSYQRILFVAHRQEILLQAAKAFKKIHQTENIGLLDQDHKDLDAKILMASVLTLSSDQYLNHEIFSRKAFDYIVIDEFHHAAAKSYQKILDYLQPKFLLGLSATPERTEEAFMHFVTLMCLTRSIFRKQSIDHCWFHSITMLSMTIQIILK